MPKTSDYIYYVGTIASQWASLEFYIDGMIARLAGVKPEIGGCITANLQSIHLKLRSLRALLEFHGASKKLLGKITTFQNKVSGTADKRNRVVHHPWMTGIVVDPASKRSWTEVTQFVSRADQKGRQFGIQPRDLNELIEINREIMRRIVQFHQLCDEINGEMPSSA